jgi:hypothetical protein
MQVVQQAPTGYVMTVREPKRSLDQNALFWVLLTELSIQKPEGRVHTPETWKGLVMHACGHECQFQMGLNGEPFPVGFRSSNLNKAQMGDLIEWIYAYGAQNGVVFGDQQKDAA